jgi:glycosyltransferase involved in cell wall biosynthesis
LIDQLAHRNGGHGNVPLLVVSIPNVAHHDLAARLLLGHWDITEVGLLDATHVSLFTEQRLAELTARHGFAEITRSDVVFPVTEQHDPDLPVFGSTSLAEHLAHIGRRASPSHQTYQFVRSYGRADGSAAPVRSGSSSAPATADPFLSVAVRTVGDRTSLTDTLVCLAAQRDRDIEVLVMVHHHSGEVLAAVEQLAESFEAEFAGRITVRQVDGGGRSAPLNAALSIATGRYFAILDDDDVVTSEWVTAFRRAADASPGRMVRARTVVQWIEPRTGGLIDFEPVSGFEATYPRRFDFVDSVRSNRSPPCSYAVPLGAVRALAIGFDGSLRVCEDWKFEIDVARFTGVSDDDAVTSVYRRWRRDGGSAAAEDEAVWIADHERVVDDLDTVPTLFPAGSLRRVHELYRRIEQLEVVLGRRSPDDGPLRFDDN